MRVERVDAATFRRDAWPVLLRDEIPNNLMFSVLAAIERGAFVRSRLWLVRRGREVACAALQGEPYSLIFTPADAEALDALSDELANEDLRGVQGAGEGAAERLARAIAARSGRVARPGMLDFVYVLEGAVRRPDVPGTLVPATEQHLALLDDWGVRFCRDCDLPDRPEDVALKNRMAVDRSTAFLWLDDRGAAAAMAFQTGETPRAGRVGMVYVPDDRRGGGFGRAVTAALSERILASGKAICCLLADSANPVSNRAYEAVGYRRVARFDEWLLSSGRP